jgi:branched-chain amino acid transport system substrate-binding protein
MSLFSALSPVPGYSAGFLPIARITHGRYERNSLAVENGLADILLADPEPKAVIIVGTYAPAAKFITLAREYGLKSLFLNVSFVGDAPLALALGPDENGVIVTQVVPPLDASLPVVKNFHRAMRLLDPSISSTSGALEGYIATRILIQALTRIDGQISRKSIINALEGLGEFDLGIGITLTISQTEHQASHQIWPTIIREGEILPFGWNQLQDLL